MKSTVIGAELIAKSKFNMYNLDYIKKDGSFEKIQVVTKKTEPKATSKNFSADVISIIAYHIDDPNKIVLLKQYRPSIDNVLIEIPNDKIIVGETIKSAAIRILKKQTGLNIIDFMDITPPVYSSAGVTDESVVFVYCTCDGNISIEQNTNTDEVESFWIDRKDIKYLFNGKYFEEKINFCAKTYTILVYNMLT